jgi:hypothetical protein
MRLRLDRQQEKPNLTIRLFGMGVESTTILMRWPGDASGWPCQLPELIVTAAYK